MFVIFLTSIITESFFTISVNASPAQNETFSKHFQLHCRMAFDFDPYKPKEHSDPEDPLYVATKGDLLTQCDAVDMGWEFTTDCVLLGFWGKEGGHVRAFLNVTVSAPRQRALNRITDWGMKYALMKQMTYCGEVYLDSEYRNDQQNRNWMYNRMLICASCFAGVTLLVALYIYVSAAWAKYSAQQRKEREERRQMELKERENQRKRRIYGERAVSSTNQVKQTNTEKKARPNDNNVYFLNRGYLE